MSGDARDKLTEILNDREYQVYYDDSKGLIATTIDRVKAWIGEQFAKLFSSFEVTSGVSGFVFIAVIFAIIAILIVVLVAVSKNMKRNRTFRESKPLQDINELNWSFQRHIEEGNKQESVGEYTLATRHIFLALLLYFHKIKWLEARIWKTNWEYYEELRNVNHKGAEFFYDFVLLFDQITYGNRLVTKEEYIQYRDEAMKWIETNKQSIEK